MAVTEDEDRDEGRLPEEIGDEGGNYFVWDDRSQLYYHSRSGFYHDPNAGWYYNTNDDIYYKFEDDHYIPWNSILKNDEELDNANQDDSGTSHISTDEEIENPPPSEWLEETLINLYLSGYSNEPTFEKYGEGDGMNVGEEVEDKRESRERIFEEEISSGEEKWLAQYGQVVKSEPEAALNFPVVDLWEWKIVNEKVKGRKLGTRLVGRPVKRAKKLHPSMPAGAGFLKSAPVCKVNLDLVQVETGKIYRLRNPSAKYLSSVSNYDSSDPTKNWGFPRLSIESLSSRTGQPELSMSTVSLDSSTSSTSFQNHHQHYRNRASERRSLHGGFGIGIGQKHHHGDDDDADDGDMIHGSYHEDGSLSDAFGSQSYGRRVLESMGWKEGEAIGKTNKGLLKPLQVAGNKGTAGLGWSSESIV